MSHDTILLHVSSSEARGSTLTCSLLLPPGDSVYSLQAVTVFFTCPQRTSQDVHTVGAQWKSGLGKEEREAGSWWKKAKTPEPSTNAAHLQLLSFHLRRRARRLHFHRVLLHQVLQALPQLLSELLLLLFRLMSDFTKVLFILLLQALYFTACSFLGL